MATITTKYSIGDVVYHAGTTTERKQHPCPDCNGTRKWKAVSPAGQEYEFGCPRCGTQYHGKDELSLAYTAAVPRVERRTIGSVQYNSAPGSWDHGARYMCLETGVGGGTVYNEDSLFSTEAAALEAAEALATKENTSNLWIVKLYNKSLEVCDYQLGSAALKKASEVESRARSMLWNVNDLFTAINDAGDLDAAREAVDEYRSWYWESDIKEVRDRDGSAEGNSPAPQGDRPNTGPPPYIGEGEVSVSMIERVARTLETQAWAALGTGDTLAYKNRRVSSLRKARAAIEAMREPSPLMLEAGVDNLFGAAHEDWSEDAYLIWQAMIDTALTPQPDLER